MKNFSLVFKNKKKTTKTEKSGAVDRLEMEYI